MELTGRKGVIFHSITAVLILLAFVAVRVEAATDPFSLLGDDDELRLRLDDPEQVRRTTSLNWIDMALEAHRARPARVFRVMLDPGHGGHDDGAITSMIVEKQLALRLSYLVRKELERKARQLGLRLEVQLTRENDEFLSLGRRVQLANDWEADLFVSIHGNSSPARSAKGFEVYFLDADPTDRAARRLAHLENGGAEVELSHGVQSILSDVKKNRHVNESSDFAETVFSAMALRLESSGRGVRQAPFKVLSGTEMPALLLEVGYLTNAKEAKALTKEAFLRRLAAAISAGILDFTTRLRRFG